ncbi:hypothetical protein PR202_ga08569 [Eleusine coracana subsp. coracana]|uniref:Uncharacterized protein n=1 Tax=Eleusine coracana subsp. coracana TaxID=191504 RepID=A0AAV5C2I7_ELECO|nr:hypothetical protein PR202_ga08569 [Eleusine coracana subsp. coracana]
MVRVATYFAMTFGAFLFWQSMDKVHVWIALHQDEKVNEFTALNLSPSPSVYSNPFIVTVDATLTGSVICLAR